MTEPFWEAGYADTGGPSVFGSPSEEMHVVVGKLPAAARVLDLGCGDGRNALFLLQQGLRVTAVDISAKAVAKLIVGARAYADLLQAEVADVREHSLRGPYALIIAHGLLHLMPRVDWSRLLGRIQGDTAPHGYNVVAVFTNALPPPADLEGFTLGLFREGELLERYAGWRVALYRSYVLEDEHPGGIRHRHAVNKIVAQKAAS